MSNKPIQVLSDSEIQSDICNSNICKYEFADTDILELTQSDCSEPIDTNQYTVKTKDNIDLKTYKNQSGKISNIIKKLDSCKKHDNNNDDNIYNCNNSDILTQTQYTTTIKDMRNDMLAMINLVERLNNNYTKCESELAHIKEELYKTVQENINLNKKVNEFKLNNEKHYNSMTILYEQQFKKIFKKLNITDTEIRNTIFNKLENSYNDNKKDKITVVQKRTLNNSRNIIGENNIEELNISTPYIQPIKKDKYEDTAKNNSDGKEYRMKRLRFNNLKN